MVKNYNIWASTVRDYVDWCPISAILKTKHYESVGKLSSERCFNILVHNAYENLYIEKWNALIQKKRTDAETLRTQTINSIDELIRNNWENTIVSSLDENSEQTIKEYTNEFKAKFDNKQLEIVCKNVANAVNHRFGNDYRILVECRDKDILKNNELGIGARPDFFISMGNIIMVADVKKGAGDGAKLQNVMGYLVLEKNKKSIARKMGLDPKEVIVKRDTLIEDYVTGNEIGYLVTDEDIEKTLEIVSKIRETNLDETQKISREKMHEGICSLKKEEVCGQRGVCVKLFGSFRESF